MKKQFYILSALCALFVLTACVPESKSDFLFRQPSKEDSNKAISLYVQIAMVALGDKNYEKAMSSVKRALDIDKNSPTALNALAMVYQYQGDTDKARDAFKKAISKDDSYSEAHLNYAQFLIQQKDYRPACKQYQMAADNDFYAKRSQAYFELSQCYRMLGDVAKAEEALTRCLGLDPANMPASGMMASIKFDQGKYAEAKELFDKHVQMVRESNQLLSAEALWLGIRLEKVFGNKDAEASWALFLKNNYPYSKEYLEYQDSLKK